MQAIEQPSPFDTIQTHFSGANVRWTVDCFPSEPQIETVAAVRMGWYWGRPAAAGGEWEPAEDRRLQRGY